MGRLLLEKTLRRWAMVVACAPLVMLAGCPQDPSAAPGKAPATGDSSGDRACCEWNASAGWADSGFCGTNR